MDNENGLEEVTPWLVVFLTLAGGFLRALLLDLNGLWVDETFSIWLASHRAAEMLQWIVRIDQHPPLYYLLLHYWMAVFGDTPYDARFLSVIFGAATIPIIYLIGKRMSGELMGLAAAVFLAVSPYHIFFAQEARMYTLLTFNASVAIYALVRLLTDPRSAQPIGSQFREYLHAWRAARPPEPEAREDFSYQDETRIPSGWRAWISRIGWVPVQTIETDLAWTGLILFSAATLYSHNTAVLFPLAANIFVLGLLLFQRNPKTGAQALRVRSGTFQAPSLRNWIKAQVAIFILWGPWIYFFVKQASAVYQRFWIPEPTWEIVLQVLKSFVNASAPLPPSYAIIIWSLYGLLFCFGLLHFRKKFSQLFFLTALFAIPFLGELIVSLFRPIFYGRTLIWITIPLFLVAAAGIAQFRFRFLILGALGIFASINLFSASDYFRFYEKEDWYTAAGYVANLAVKDDLVLFNSNFVVIPFDYYFKPFERKYSIQVEKRGLPLDLFESGRLEPVMTNGDIPQLISLLSGHKRVWLVYSHDSYTDPMGLIPQTLASRMKLTRTRDFYGGQVQLYEAP